MANVDNEQGDPPALRARVVPLRGPITKRSVFYFISRLLYLAAESPKEPILMEITSPGGLIPQSLEIIRIMDSVPCAVNTFCRGMVRGTAAVIAGRGARGFRTALPGCRFSFAFGDAGAPALSGEDPEALTRQMADLLVNDGVKGREQILSWLRTGAEFSAQEALNAGLIDFISKSHR